MICHNCKRDCEEFTLDNGETAYWFCVPKGYNDPEYLMSDLTYSFLASLEKEPTETDEHDYWCLRCIEAIGGESE